MTHLLEQVPALDAVFVNSDLMAIGAIREIHLIYYNPSNECCPEM